MGRRKLLSACVCGCAVILLAACSAAHKQSSTADRATLVKQAFNDVFSSKKSLNDRESSLENGAAFASVLTSKSDGAMSATVGAVTFSDASHGAVSFALTAGSTHLPSIAGAAVLHGTSWQVSASTMCVVLAATHQQSAACS